MLNQSLNLGELICQILRKLGKKLIGMEEARFCSMNFVIGPSARTLTLKMMTTMMKILPLISIFLLTHIKLNRTLIWLALPRKKEWRHRCQCVTSYMSWSRKTSTTQRSCKRYARSRPASRSISNSWFTRRRFRSWRSDRPVHRVRPLRLKTWCSRGLRCPSNSSQDSDQSSRWCPNTPNLCWWVRCIIRLGCWRLTCLRWRQLKWESWQC